MALQYQTTARLYVFVHNSQRPFYSFLVPSDAAWGDHFCDGMGLFGTWVRICMSAYLKHFDSCGKEYSEQRAVFLSDASTGAFDHIAVCPPSDERRERSEAEQKLMPHTTALGLLAARFASTKRS